MTHTIVTWLWRGSNLSRRLFKPEYIETFASNIRKHTRDVRIICLHDGKTDTCSANVEWMPMPAAAHTLLDLKSPEGERFPSCYSRLWLFSREASEHLCADRVLLLDSDLVVLRSLAPLFDPPENFVGWLPIRDWGSKVRVGGGIYLLKLGTRTDVWTEFVADPTRAIRAARLAGFRGSDQAWLSYKLAHGCVIYPPEAGIYSIRDLDSANPMPPSGARLVQFNGPVKPWQSTLGWVRAEWPTKAIRGAHQRAV